MWCSDVVDCKTSMAYEHASQSQHSPLRSAATNLNGNTQKWRSAFLPPGTLSLQHTGRKAISLVGLLPANQQAKEGATQGYLSPSWRSVAVLRLLDASLLTPLMPVPGPFPFMPEPMFASPSSDEPTTIDCNSSSFELPPFDSASLIALL